MQTSAPSHFPRNLLANSEFIRRGYKIAAVRHAHITSLVTATESPAARAGDLLHPALAHLPIDHVHEPGPQPGVQTPLLGSGRKAVMTARPG